MARFTSSLDNVKVAAPCSADWDEMGGNEQVRFCGHCNLNVYNLSGMTKKEAESLIANAEGRLCIRFYQRTDGTILTDNCPVGLRAIRKRLSRAATAIISAALSFFAGLAVYAGLSEPDRPAPSRVMGQMVIPERRREPATQLPSIQGEMMVVQGGLEALDIRPAKVTRLSSKLRRHVRR